MEWEGEEGRGLTLSMRAEREMKGDESVERGSFMPSRYTSSRGISQVNGYTCYHYKRVTPNRKRNTTHLVRGIRGSRRQRWIRTNRNPSQAILTNTQHPHIPFNLYRIPLQRQGVHRQSQLSSCNKSGEKGSKSGPSTEDGRHVGRDVAGCLSSFCAD